MKKKKVQGLKITHFVRNRKLEQKLQKELLDILEKPEYEKLPMLIMKDLRITQSKTAILEMSEWSYYFIIINNLFKG
jgi:predicted house-cleaning noncanonical NTP pyrophosphatase (MazG superfamily)